MFFSRGLIGANSKGESAVEVSASTLVLNGSNQYLSITDSTSIMDLEGGDKSHAIWFKTSSSGTNLILSKGDQNNNYFYDIYIESGQVQARARSSSGSAIRHYKTTAATFADDAWHHIVVRWNSFGTYEIFVDNVNEALTAVSTDTIATPFADSDPFIVGAVIYIGAAVGHYNGSLSIAYIYDKTLTASEIATLYNNGTPVQPWLIGAGLKSSMALGLPLNDQTNSNQYSDYSGNSNDATATGSPTITGVSLTIVNSSDKGP